MIVENKDGTTQVWRNGRWVEQRRPKARRPRVPRPPVLDPKRRGGVALYDRELRLAESLSPELRDLAQTVRDGVRLLQDAVTDALARQGRGGVA